MRVCESARVFQSSGMEITKTWEGRKEGRQARGRKMAGGEEITRWVDKKIARCREGESAGRLGYMLGYTSPTPSYYTVQHSFIHSFIRFWPRITHAPPLIHSLTVRSY